MQNSDNIMEPTDNIWQDLIILILQGTILIVLRKVLLVYNIILIGPYYIFVIAETFWL